jgi:hypothetical protein
MTERPQPGSLMGLVKVRDRARAIRKVLLAASGGVGLIHLLVWGVPAAQILVFGLQVGLLAAWCACGVAGGKT